MLLLTADTSGPEGSLALAKISGDVIQDISEVHWVKKAMHSEVATLQLQTLLRDAHCEFSQVTHLAVNIGPGSFTGLRVGVSLIRTYAYVQSKPVALVNRLELLAFNNTRPGEKIFLATKAVQNFYYAAGYERIASSVIETVAPQSMVQSEIELHSKNHTKVLIEGTENGLVAETTAKNLVQLLAMESGIRHFSPWSEVKPLYIRGSEAEEKLKRGLLKPL